MPQAYRNRYRPQSASAVVRHRAGSLRRHAAGGLNVLADGSAWGKGGCGRARTVGSGAEPTLTAGVGEAIDPASNRPRYTDTL